MSQPMRSALLEGLQKAMPAIFLYFESKLIEMDGQILSIDVKAEGGKVDLSYGVRPIEEGGQP